MKATDLLESQHRLVEKLFDQYENAKDMSEKTSLFEQIAKNLVGHDAIEREIFFRRASAKSTRKMCSRNLSWNTASLSSASCARTRTEKPRSWTPTSRS